MSKQQSTPDEQQVEIPTWKLWLGRAVRGFLVLFILYALTFLVLYFLWSSDFETALKKAKEEGDYIPLKELEEIHEKKYPDRYTYSPEETIFPEEISRKEEEYLEEMNWPYSDHRRDHLLSKKERKEKSKTLLKFIRNHSKYYEKLLQKKFKPADVHLTRGFKTKLPHIQKFLKYTNLLRNYGLAHLYAGKKTETLRAIKQLMNMCDALAADPFLISFSVRISIFNRAFEVADEYLTIHRKKAGNDLAFLLKQLKPEMWREGFKNALKGDFSSSVHGINTFADDTIDIVTPVSSSAAPFKHSSMINLTRTVQFLFHPVYLKNKANLIRDYSTLMHAMHADDPYYKHADLIKQKMETFRSQTSDLLHFLSKMLIPALDHSREELASTVARIHLLKLAIKMEAHRAKNNNLPDDLPLYNSLKDPFSGSVFRKKESENKIIFYSIGPNMKDDEGDQSGEGDDISIQLRK